MTIEMDIFNTTTIAMIVFFVGYGIVRKVKVLRDYSIPEAMVGGAACAIAIALLHALANVTITFDLSRRDILLVYFFAALGLRANLRDLLANGRPLGILVGLAAVFIVIQNTAGMLLADAFGHDPRVGIVAGSMALIGRSGTTVAWAPIFESTYGLAHMSRLGTAVNMIGLLAACCIGGPIALALIRRFRLSSPGTSAQLDVGAARTAPTPQLDYYAFLLALLRIHVAVIFGELLRLAPDAAGIHLPLYVTTLAAGLLLGNLMPRLAPKVNWPASDQCLTLIAYVSLGLFYTMTLMSLQLWTAGAFIGFVLAVIVVQVLLVIAFIWFVVFPAMGRDYEAAVISGGFAGMSLGSTATTMAIMTAVTREYGRAQKAFMIVPIACGFFIDIINSFAIIAFAMLGS